MDIKTKSISKKEILKISKELIAITLGCFIYAFAINEFFVPNKLAEGGVTGISLVIYYLTKFPIGISYLIINIPIAILAFKTLGKEFFFKTLFGILVLSFALKLTENLGEPIDDVLLGSLFGGFISGIGMGIVFINGGSTGGMDVIARIMTRYKGIPVGKALLIIDFIVLTIAGFIFGKIVFMYTLVALFVASKIIDLLEEGKHVAKSVMVISDEYEEIKRFIIEELDRSCTVLKGEGAYLGKEQKIIYVILSKYQIIKFKIFMKTLDPDAFIVINDAVEVLGEGFKNIKQS